VSRCCAAPWPRILTTHLASRRSTLGQLRLHTRLGARVAHILPSCRVTHFGLPWDHSLPVASCGHTWLAVPIHLVIRSHIIPAIPAHGYACPPMATRSVLASSVYPLFCSFFLRLVSLTSSTSRLLSDCVRRDMALLSSTRVTLDSLPAAQSPPACAAPAKLCVCPCDPQVLPLAPRSDCCCTPTSSRARRVCDWHGVSARSRRCPRSRHKKRRFW
jgi:hypothetical protein